MFIISEKAQEFMQTNKEVENFQSVPYKENMIPMSLLQCIETITNGENSRLDILKEGETLCLTIGKKSFIIDSFECPKPDWFDTNAKVRLLNGRYLIEYAFKYNEQYISRVIVTDINSGEVVEDLSRPYKEDISRPYKMDGRMILR